MVRRGGDLLLLQWWVFESAFPAIAAGDWDAAAALVDEAMVDQWTQRATRATSPGSWPTAAGSPGWPGGAARRSTTARRAAAMDSHAWFAAAVQAMYATTLIEAGRAAEAVPVLERGLAAAETHRTEAYRLRCLAPLAEATGSTALVEEADALIEGDHRAARARPGCTARTPTSRWPGPGWPAASAGARAEILDAAAARVGPHRLGGAAGRRARGRRARAAQSSSASSAAARSAPSVSTGR